MSMNVGVLKMRLHLPENLSLKGKRQVIKSVVAQLQNKFHVSAAEVADNDLWQVATVGAVYVSNDPRFTNEVLSKAAAFVEGGNFDVEFMGYGTEIIPL
ncbi:MAG: DUF503 domain-containing protein [Dehalococcoidia bacterium]|nr:DUF503 domain-containing protein [Dehalococcoidia bacterium]